MSRKDLLILGAGLILGSSLGLYLFFGDGLISRLIGRSEEMGGRQVDSSPEIGLQAPDFELSDLSGNQVRLSELKGKVVLLNFWATWCAPCRTEMPALNARYKEHRPQLEVLAINFDESVDIVSAFVSEMGLGFRILLDPGGNVQLLYRLRGYPTTYVLDQEGIVRIQHIGLMTEAQLDRYLAEVGLQ